VATAAGYLPQGCPAFYGFRIQPVVGDQFTRLSRKMVGVLRHNNFRRSEMHRQRNGEVLGQPDAIGYLELGALSHRLEARSSEVLHVALFSLSRRSGWRFEISHHAGLLFIKATGKISMEVM
jgi:hypothetical protein